MMVASCKSTQKFPGIFGVHCIHINDGSSETGDLLRVKGGSSSNLLLEAHDQIHRVLYNGKGPGVWNIRRTWGQTQ